MNIDEIKKTFQEAELKIMQKRNEQITQELTSTLSKAQLSKEELLQAISQIQINVPEVRVPDINVPEIKAPSVPEIKIPEIKIPEIKIPDIKVPRPEVTVNVPPIKIPEIKIPKIATPKVPKPEVTVNVPKIKIPDLKWPEEEMPIKGWVQLMGVDFNNPLPVQLRDSQGNPVAMPQGGSGGAIRSEVSIKKPRSVKMFNVEMAVADTEYSQQLPEGTRAMTIQNREGNDMRMSYEVSKVATSTVAFMTVKGGQAYYETNVDLSSKTVYVASGRAGVAEIVAYY